MNEQKLLKQFAAKTKMEFRVKDISVYKNGKPFFGYKLDTALCEQYMAISCTTVFRTAEKSILVTHLNIDDNSYIISFLSDKPDTFDGQEAQYIITDVKSLRERIKSK